MHFFKFSHKFQHCCPHSKGIFCQVCSVQHHSAFAVLPSLTVPPGAHTGIPVLLSCQDTFTAFSRASISKRDCVLRLGGSRLTAPGIATPLEQDSHILSRTSEKNHVYGPVAPKQVTFTACTSMCIWEDWTLHTS